MKLSTIKQLPILSETTVTSVDAAAFANQRMVNQMADDIANMGFPSDFHLQLNASDKTRFEVRYELESKSINEDTGYHTLTFNYGMDSKSRKQISEYLKKLEKDDSDPEGEKYDEAADELKYDTLVVYADLSVSINKVWGKAS